MPKFDLKGTLLQAAALLLGIILLLGSVNASKFLSVLSSLNIPQDWTPFTIGAACVLFFYTIIK